MAYCLFWSEGTFVWHRAEAKEAGKQNEPNLAEIQSTSEYCGGAFGGDDIRRDRSLFLDCASREDSTTGQK